MKDEIRQTCAFCGSEANGSNPNERLHIHRWVKAPQRASKREKITIDFPTCEECYREYHPYSKLFLRFAICACVIAAACVLFGFIQREMFTISGIIAIIICTGGAAIFTWFGYSLTYLFFDDTFRPSVKTKPYKDMPVVKYLLENGFVDENDEKCETIDTNSSGFTQFMTIRDTIKNKFGFH